MSKAILVALREYMENLRTKAFWIGIMAFPLILVLAIAVPILLEKEKDVREYAVIDRSGWLLDAVEERSAMPDIGTILDQAKEKFEKGGEEFEELPPILRELAPQADVKKEIINNIGFLMSMLTGPEFENIIDELEKFVSGIQPEMEKMLLALLASMGVEKEDLELFKQGWRDYKEIRKWFEDLPSHEAEKYSAGLAKSRYERIYMVETESDPEEELKKMLNEDKLFAYFVIGPDPVGSPDGAEAAPGETDESVCKYVSNNLTDTDLKNWFSRHANSAVSAKRILKAEIARETAEWLNSPVVFESKKVSKEGEEEEVAKEDTMRQWAPVVFVYLLWISIFTITQMLLTNTIEEKSNKIMEVLLSSVSPIQLMAGKIIGIAGTGLTMVVSWIIFFFLSIKYMPLLFGKGPDFDLTLIIRDPIYLCSFVAYFILGYLLLSAILVGIGSVCSSLKEAQNLMAPVTIILIVPLLAMVPIGQDPNGTIARVLSYFPPFTPFVMMNRAAGPPSSTEYVVTSILLVVSIIFALWAAAKVFRVGILMTGKPPKMLEILKWIRAPVGHVQSRKE